ncbi:MAG: Alkyl hydroperoxide reductase and/or thiol-specific antioxidant family (AhpC/TSA) protein [uncultured Sphingomonas sp.]|uniref:Alkyl hydroperoxide reductase and/or thiol-specific antioxidant family (AhpC/TSA) protein n=1 Tax=uncultured Sphingomonas sp. TaxID=158754 RepID=A0A6J4STT8_9SPHN|nr:MAG: Alkyl hydroperoxide reductase and/or thiol-specific antioxidant family (AhpC/TSA) protein [uncultured Sphingomonas sp.]
MMRMIFLAAAVALVAAPVAAEPKVGQPAPNFQLTDANGKRVSLNGFRGKTVVLEWNNPECPFVKKHYDSGNMQKAQARATADGAVWLTINSSAAGKQGYMAPAAAKAFAAKQASKRSAYLLDPSGRVGKLYGAKTTPHMYIINPKGTLTYIGGIDNKPSPNPADIATARNHVLAALTEMKAGKGVSVATSRPYGCAVKYAG